MAMPVGPLKMPPDVEVLRGPPEEVYLSTWPEVTLTM
jgi:hypothetical protein